MAHVNLWELITTVANKTHRTLPNQEKCEEIQKACAQKPSFASELSLEVEDGVWTVKMFNHEDSDQHVTLRVLPNGGLSVTRGRTRDDVREERRVTF